MRFSLTADHREFFNKNQFIELEEVLPLDQVALLKKNAEETVAKRLGVTVGKLSHRPAPDIYQAGYDLWRNSEAIKKITHKHSLAAVDSELFQTVPLRYAYDQYFAMTHCTSSPYALPVSLQEISCLQPLAGALILPLHDLASPPSFFPLPLKMGSGLFISPNLSLPWPELFFAPGLEFLLIAFSPHKTSFRADSKDPHAVSLKRLGYVFNDQLNDSLHPIVLRKNA
jgi:hypothetical protein